MPEFEQPTLTVRISYPGVGPLEMEELDHAADRAGGQRRARPDARPVASSEGNSQVQLNFEWGEDLSEAADEVRTRVDRMRGRLPEDADPPTIFKFDSNSQPIMQIGIEGDYDPVTLREVAQNEIAPRFERVDGVAAVTVNGGVRRQIHVELSKEKITALNLSVNQRRADAAHREPEHAARRDLPGRLDVPASAARASSRASRTSAISSC